MTNYLNQITPARDEQILEIEHYAAEHRIPIMELIAMEAMLQILRLIQPMRILEIGTAIGYSAIRMAKAIPNVKVVTVERDKERYDKAMQNIAISGTGTQIQVILGDALEQVEAIKAFAPYDVLFIDAAKGQYKRFFESYEPFLNDSAVIITDNVLFKGLVAENNIDNRNIRALARKINTYNKWLLANPNYDTTILPIGDGIAISKKK